MEGLNLSRDACEPPAVQGDGGVKCRAACHRSFRAHTGIIADAQ
jgi:hypothetical protein